MEWWGSEQGNQTRVGVGFRDNERKAHKTGELGRGQGLPSWPGAPSPVSVSHAH